MALAKHVNMNESCNYG